MKRNRIVRYFSAVENQQNPVTKQSFEDTETWLPLIKKLKIP